MGHPTYPANLNRLKIQKPPLNADSTAHTLRPLTNLLNGQMEPAAVMMTITRAATISQPETGEAVTKCTNKENSTKRTAVSAMTSLTGVFRSLNINVSYMLFITVAIEDTNILS